MSNHQHYFTAIRQRLERLYEEHPNDARLREQISDEVDWIDAQLERSPGTPDVWEALLRRAWKQLADPDLRNEIEIALAIPAPGQRGDKA
jgi:hypothetical protein